jgi:hypothetical protein
LAIPKWPLTGLVEEPPTSIKNPSLANILRDIKLTFRAFERLSFHHILGDFNSKADKLSGLGA